MAYHLTQILRTYFALETLFSQTSHDSVPSQTVIDDALIVSVKDL
ncbi:hypothetical protein N878_00295 [Pseudomonas sp. EGD-AK9]|nr:hypothetical protein N878_00295 [Pseudomonas sp. EGD-AK9]